MRQLLSVAALVVCAGVLNAATINVPADQPTIQAGIDAASSGDTVLVAPAVYVENLLFPTERIFVVSSLGPEVTYLSHPGGGGYQVEILAGASGCFSGFTIEGVSEGTNLVFAGDSVDAFTVSNNRFLDCGVRDVVRGGGGLNVYRNLFVNSPATGNIMVTTGPDCSFINNTVVGGQRGLAIYGVTSTILNNIIINVTEYAILGPHATSVVDYNDFYNNGSGNSPGPNGFSLDPLFAAPSIGDYSLQSTSPCIDAGEPDPQYNDPDGTRNDMGAFPRHVVLLPVPVHYNLGPEDQMHVVGDTPTFYWTFYDTAGSQAAYNIEVGTDTNWSVAEMWASGEVYSADSSVVYAGAPLEDGITYFYHLRVNNGSAWGDWMGTFLRMNSKPTAPNSVWPTTPLPLLRDGIKLLVDNSSDAELDSLFYDFEIYSDSELTILVAYDYGVAEQSVRTPSRNFSELSSGVSYWWRARADDQYEHSDWSMPESFVMHEGSIVINVPADVPTIQAGIDVALDGDTVLVAAGTYVEDILFDGEDILVVSSDGPGVTTIQPPVSIQFISGEGPGCQLNGFTVLNGIAINGSGPVISGCVFRDIAGMAIRCNGYPTIEYNLFFNNGSISCIGIDGGTARIINNTFDNNNRGFYNNSGQGVAKNNIVTNSIAYGIHGNWDTLDYNDVWNNNPDYQSGPGAGPHDISADPQYTDASIYSYTLQPTSPCIDAGDPDPQYNDLDGSRSDMGAIPHSHSYPEVHGITLGAENLTHVLNHTPTFFWSFFDTAISQVAYEIEVGTDVDWAIAEMWATGEVFSGDSSAVYSGAPLIDGVTYYFQIRLNNGTTWGDWVGNFLRMNSRPTVPGSIWPTTPLLVQKNGIGLLVDNSTDSELDTLFYDFEIYSDSELTTLAAYDYGVAEQTDRTQSRNFSELSSGVSYWWRSRAYDEYEYSNWMPPESFIMHEGSRTIHIPADLPTIQAGIDAAVNGDTVLVAPGTYTENISFSGKGIFLLSSAGRDATFIEQATSGVPIVTFSSGEDTTSVLDGFTVRNATGNHGIDCKGANPIIQNCDISFCTNAGGDGAGIWCDNSGPLIRYNMIHDNQGGSTGGGIGGSGSPEIAYNRIYGNSAASGPSIWFISGSDIHIHHNVIFGNTGWEELTGVYINGSNCEIVNNTIVGNTKGITLLDGSGTLILNNIVVSNELSGISPGAAVVDYNNVWSNGSDNYSGPNGISVDPLFFDAVNFDYFLQPSSLCINVGDPDPQYNDPDGTRSDMGAFYYSPFIFPIAQNLSFGLYSEGHTVYSLTPVIYWTYFDTTATTQSAYQMQIGTDDDWSVAEMWDSGEIYSSDQESIYAGTALNDNTTYYLRIQLHNGTDWGDWRDGWFFTHVQQIIDVPADLPTIQQAIDVTVDGDTVLVADGIYNEEVSFLGKKITVASHYLIDPDTLHINNTIIDGGVRFVTAEDTTSILSGFSLQNGGVYIGDFDLNTGAQVNDCHFLGNGLITSRSGDYPGSGGPVLIRRCHFVDCGIQLAEDTHVSIHSCEIDGDVGVNGMGSWTIDSSTIGGSVRGEGQITASTVRGTLVAGYDEVTIYAGNCTIGRVYTIDHSTATLDNCVIGVVEDPTVFGGGVTARHCIVTDTVYTLNTGMRFAQSTLLGPVVRMPIDCKSTKGIRGRSVTLDTCILNVWRDSTAGQDMYDYAVVGNCEDPWSRLYAHCCVIYGFRTSWLSGEPDVIDTSDVTFLDPLFCDPTAGDFRIHETSPCAPANSTCGVQIGAFGVGCYNVAPVLNPIGPQVVNEGDTICFTVSATDPEATIPVLSADNLPPGATFIDSGNGSGLFCWAPTYEQAGVYAVTFVASDGFLSDSESVQITVNNVNRPPVVTPPSDTVIIEGILLELLVTASDPDSTLPSLAADDLPSGASFVDSGNGVGLFTWTPGYDQSGIHPVIFVASDGTLADSAVVQITVNNVNRPPVVTQPVDTTIDEGTPLELIVAATDPDGTIPLLSVDSLPPGATFVDSSNGTGLLTWTPDFTQAGIYSVLFIAVDDSSAVDSGVTVITVNHVNLPPVLDSVGPRELYESQHLEIVVTASDFDEDELSLIAEGLPANASFIDSGNGRGLFQFDPQPDQSGVHPILFVVSDGSLDDSELVEITVYDAEPIINFIKVGGEIAPQHLVDHTPLIEWSYTDPLERRAQTQVEVAVGTDNDWQYAEMWNPAPFQTADTFVTYAGIELVDGETYYLRLRVHNGVAWSDWYETNFRMNSLPSMPMQLSPIDDVQTDNQPWLWIQNSSDAESDALTYDYEVYDDPAEDFPVASTYNIPEQLDSTGWAVDIPLTENEQYFWLTRSNDQFEYSVWSGYESFWVNGTPEPPTAPNAQYPPDTGNMPVFNMLPTFSWSASTDPDPLDTVRYKLEVSINPGFTFVQTVDSLLNASHTLTDSLTFGTHYWWRVTAVDKTGLSTMSPNTPDFWTWTLGDMDCLHTVDISDLVILVDWMFNGGPVPCGPPFVADIDGSCTVDISDLVYLVDYMFSGGPAPLVGCE